jgi:hypothetical protein
LEQENQKIKSETKNLIIKTKKIMESMDAHKLNDLNNKQENDDMRMGRTHNIPGVSKFVYPCKRSHSNSLEVKNNSYDRQKLTNEDVFLKSN